MSSNIPLDESLYSRQIYVLGHEAMNRIRESNILISGLGGVGVELAKCIILGGVKSVTLHSEKNVKYSDLSTQYYFSEKDIGKNRTICVNKLKELNPSVEINVTTDDLRNVIRSNKFDIVVMTDNTLIELISVNQITREKNIKFIACIAYGGFGYVFCDFGDCFIVNDIDGEEIKSGIILDLYSVNNNDEVIAIQTVEPHNLAEGDFIKIKGYDKEFTTIKIKDTKTFIIKSPYSEKIIKKEANLTFQQIKHPKILKFYPLIESLTRSDFVMTDIIDFTRPNTLHALFQAIDRFEVKHNRLPKTWDNNDAEELYTLTTQIYPEANKDVVYKLSYTLQGQLCALSSMIGSIGAQEVMKASSSKFHPIHQWFYYDITSNLPDSPPFNNLSVIKKDRYYGQRLIFGDDFQEKLSKSKVFIVGSGAIGCEHLKNFSMMGIGNIIITDMDTIEKSNLNRQFLFRISDIGKFKSEIAAREINKINPLIKVTAHQNKVSTETETIYNEKFFESLTCVANALDNIQARLYVDEKCVTYRKALIESGTLGTKGNVQIIIPDMTESYGSMRDPAEQSVPVCTLKSFPYLIDHCVHFSRDLFEGYFIQAPNNTIKYLTNKELLKTMTPTEVANIVKDIKQVITHVPKTFQDCVNYAYEQWHELFRNQILQLVYNFPEDCKTSEGIPFWSGAKKYPTALEFNSENQLDLKFIESFSELWAEVFNMKHRRVNISEFVKGSRPPIFVPNEGVKINTDDSEEKIDYEIDSLIESLLIYESPEIKEVVKKMKPLIFEKDDDTNFHIDFMTSVSNLRATNYKIELSDRHKIKGIAGKIIPAIATTTSLVSSLATLELYKIINNFNSIDKYRNSFVNLAIPFFGWTEPAPAEQFKVKDKTFTFWDSIKFADVELSGIIAYYKFKYDVEIDDITVGQARFYSAFLSNKKRKERLDKKVSEIYYEINGVKAPSPIVLTLMADDYYDLPTCKVYTS